MVILIPTFFNHFFPFIKRTGSCFQWFEILSVWCSTLKLCSNRWVWQYLLKDPGHYLLVLTDRALPIFFIILQRAVFLGYIMTFFFLSYRIIKKFSSDNIYFEIINKWTKFLLIEMMLIFTLCISIPFLGKFEESASIISIIISLYTLLLIFYRPKFLNNSSLSILLSDSFNKQTNIHLKESDFVNVFYLS